MADPDTSETNITDTPGDGTTITTLVSTHDRGSLEWNERRGNGDPFGPEGPPVVVVPATGATAGTPGTWTPPGSTPPATPAATAVTASPATAWTTGQYVQTALAGPTGRTYWDGDSWNVGAAT